MPNPILRCSKCHSTNVRQNADCQQDEDTGEWEVVSFLDSFSCEDCEGECSVEEVSKLNSKQKQIQEVIDTQGDDKYQATIKITGIKSTTQYLNVSIDVLERLRDDLAD
jgi:hypothetical protein